MDNYVFRTDRLTILYLLLGSLAFARYYGADAGLFHTGFRVLSGLCNCRGLQYQRVQN